MSSTIAEIVCDLNDEVENRYQLVLEVSEIAKRLLEDANEKMTHDPFSSSASASPEKVIYQSLIMKASEVHMGNGLIG